MPNSSGLCKILRPVGRDLHHMGYGPPGQGRRGWSLARQSPEAQDIPI